ncbi:receptor-transporting protein 3-like [Emydura macquarii macquarii]|uniref:receptor-transporting protein 3-like n=1 Tax=Emydura macquarii macquarii TaxID=1129001 RepID=UPI00352A3627
MPFYMVSFQSVCIFHRIQTWSNMATSLELSDTCNRSDCRHTISYTQMGGCFMTGGPLSGGCEGEGENMKTWQRKFDLKMAQEKPEDSWSLTLEDNLNPRNPERGWHLYQQRKAFGRFQCSRCPRHWPSAQVLILFHMHLGRRRGRGQGQVKVRVCGQKCNKCSGAKFEKPTFSPENTEMILDNLVLKIHEKCYQEFFANRDLADPIVEEDVEGPHDTTRCEGCVLGICYLKGTALQIQPCSSANRFDTATSLAATSRPDQSASWGAAIGSYCKLLCYVLPVVVALLMFFMLFSGK